MSPIPGKKLDPIVCPLCSTFSSKRLTTFEEHLKTQHHTTSQKLWNDLYDGPVKCGCGCGNNTKWIGWKQGYSALVVGHNGNLVAVYGEERAAQITQLRKDKLIGQVGWARGLTKESDSRVAARAQATSVGRKSAFNEGKIEIWSKGLTKETDERLLAVADALKQKFASGERVPWHKGLTKDSDPRVAQISKDQKERYATGQLVPWSKGLTKDSDPRVAKTWKTRDPIAEYRHVRWSNEEIEEQLNKNVCLTLDVIDSYRNDRKPALNVHCRFCDWNAKVSLIFARNDRCPICKPDGSKGQNEIAAFIETLGFIVKNNVRGLIGRQELDIFIPEKNFAVEFNGLYFHNESAGKDQTYHQNKSIACAKVGIQLMHIFDDEWQTKHEIIKSMLTHKLKKTKTSIGTRKCNVITFTSEQRKKFFEENHVEGDTNALSAFGLEFNEKIVAAVSIRKQLHKSERLELARFCTALNTSVPGALTKLMNVVFEETKQNSLMTYVDTRHGTGVGYAAAGWKKIGETPPRFWWTNNHERFNRFKYRANKTAGLTEIDVADSAGVVKIWGCKNLIYEIKNGN